ncbi:MAG: hypothetical protein AB8F26_01085 [Phycisphaerales bacterium]
MPAPAIAILLASTTGWFAQLFARIEETDRRWAAIKAADHTGLTCASIEHWSWFLNNPDIYAAYLISARPRPEHHIRGELLQIVEWARMQVCSLGYPPPSPNEGWLLPDMNKAWNELRELFGTKTSTDAAQPLASIPYEHRHLKPIFGLLTSLETRRDHHSASDRDLFILEALLASDDRFKEMIAELQ